MLHCLGSNAAAAREVAEIFLKACGRRFEALRNALRSKDRDALWAGARSLRRMATDFGAEVLIAPALQLELIGRSGDLRQAREVWARLEREFGRLRPAITSLLH